METEKLLSRVWTTAESADADTLAMARVCLLDWLACVLTGAHEPLVECLVADAEPLAGSGFPLIGRGESVSLRDAVLINGAAGHALDYDDGHMFMSGHPAVTIMAPLLGLCQQRGIGGERLLRGIVAAYEAASRLGMMVSPDHYGRGFHATGTMGAMGSAVGAAWMTGGDRGLASMALGLAATRAAGLRASFGTDGKPLHAAWAGYIGLTALRWAERGMTGSPNVVEHKQGLRALTDTFDMERGLKTDDEPYIMVTSFKQFAACGVTHASIRAAMSIADRCPPEQIAKIRIRVPKLAEGMCNIADPRTGLQLKFSVRAVVGMVLLGLDCSVIANYSEDVAARADLRELIARTEVQLEGEIPGGRGEVEVTLTDGMSVLGTDPGSEILGLVRSREAVAAKFVALVSPLLGEARARALRDEVLEGTLADIPALIAATRGEKVAEPT